MSEPFWKSLSLDEMTREQWESLCDGCARCCLHKLEDEDTGEIHYTNVVCSLLVTENCTCSRYRDRSRLVPDCLVLDPASVKSLDWLPDTCAYRLIRDGEDLPDWRGPSMMRASRCGDGRSVRTRSIRTTSRTTSSASRGRYRPVRVLRAL